MEKKKGLDVSGKETPEDTRKQRRVRKKGKEKKKKMVPRCQEGKSARGGKA